MLKKIVTAFAAVAALTAAPVMAADLVVADDYVDAASATNWTGPYVGAFVGAHLGTVIEEVCDGLCAGDFSLDGAIGGIEAGYDYQVDNNWVVGGFVQVPLLKPTGSADLGGGVTFTVEPQWAINAGARLGYAMDQLLPYGFVGVAVVNSKVTSSMSGPSSATHLGLSAGFGLEARLTENFSVDGRYTYTSLGAQTYDWGGGAEKYGENAHNFTIGLKYRF